MEDVYMIKSLGEAVKVGQVSSTVPMTLAFRFATPRKLVRRMLAMAALWLFFGMFVGSTLMPDNAIGLISGAIAGALVLPWLGLILGMLGGSVKESLLGALTGILVAALSAIVRGVRIDPYNLNLCLIIGGMMGANFALFLSARVRLRQWRLAART
jgi:hypothetical protein